jgi:hypothetical protein
MAELDVLGFIPERLDIGTRLMILSAGGGDFSGNMLSLSMAFTAKALLTSEVIGVSNDSIPSPSVRGHEVLINVGLLLLLKLFSIFVVVGKCDVYVLKIPSKLLSGKKIKSRFNLPYLLKKRIYVHCFINEFLRRTALFIK